MVFGGAGRSNLLPKLNYSECWSPKLESDSRDVDTLPLLLMRCSLPLLLPLPFPSLLGWRGNELILSLAREPFSFLELFALVP